MTRKKTFMSAVLLLASGMTTPILMTGCGTSEATNTANAADRNQRADSNGGAHYNEKSELLRPIDHREWVFIGAPVTPNDMNDGKAAFPEFHNVYIDPDSFAAYKKSGKFSDGTVIMKELVSVGSKQMDSGKGYFQGDFVSLEAMVKDSVRFADEPGGWAFFRFGEAPDYQEAGTRMKTESCNACHSGAKEDYVFSDTYPVLRAAHPLAISQ